MFRIARKVARDRVISTVDVEARHGHKSRARTFDGYKTHLGVDPDDELITNVAVTPANTPDREVIDDLLDESDSSDTDAGEPDSGSAETGGFEVYADSAYADGQTLHEQAARGNDLHAKVPAVRNSHGYSKDQFMIDPEAGTVTARPGTPCRSARSAAAGRPASATCAEAARCTRRAPRLSGRVISIHPHEATLQQAKARQRDPAWQQAYRTHRPTVERKISHYVRRPWGGRKARCRGQARILTDILARASAVNLARLAALGLHHRPTGWAIA